MIKKKSLGQNFLKSPKIIGEIVSAGKVTKDDTVLEVGPGEGTLTADLLRTGSRVISIEKDDRLIPILQEKFKKEINSGQFKLIHADILESRIETVIKDDYKIVANIPYYITGQIIRKFLEGDKKPHSMTLLLQKEVAERIVAKNKKESLLSLSIKVFGDPKIIMRVPRGAFNPVPNVDSCLINIENISKSRTNGLDLKKFFKLIHTGFRYKRKQLLSNLSGFYPKEKVVKVFEKLNLDLKTRAEDVSLENWIKLCNLLSV